VNQGKTGDDCLEKAAELLGKGGELGENQRTRGKPVDEGTPSSKSV